MCASNIGCSEDVVDVYDSIPAYSIGTTTLRKQIAVILQTKSSSFKLQFVDVQRRSEGGDCALFAIAIYCDGQDPHLVRYNQCQMRRHLYGCYEGGKHKLVPFPEKKKPRGMSRRVSSITEVAVYCSCRLPHTGASGGKMI